MSSRGAGAVLLTRDADPAVAQETRHNPQPLSVIIADANDESRALYEQYAALHNSVGPAAVCATADEAKDALQSGTYDIAVLVASPEIDVWQIIDEAGDSLPTTIVVAESESGAARAFDLQLADYIVGPASCERFARAIDHAVARIDRAGNKEVFARLHSLLSSIKESSNRPSRFLVNDKRKYSFIQAADIDWVEAADNYVILHVGEKQYFVRDTMSSMESRLEGERFMRIHRSAIINVDNVKSIEPWSGTEFRFVLNDGTTLVSGRRYREKLRSLLLRG